MYQTFRHSSRTFSPVDVRVSCKGVDPGPEDAVDGYVTRAGWTCDAAPGLALVALDREPERRLDPTAGRQVSVTHLPTGVGVVNGLAKASVKAACDALLLLGRSGFDWTAPTTLDGLIDALRAHTFAPGFEGLCDDLFKPDAARWLKERREALDGLTSATLPLGVLEASAVATALGGWSSLVETLCIGSQRVRLGSHGDLIGPGLVAIREMARRLPKGAPLLARIDDHGRYRVTWDVPLAQGRSSSGALNPRYVILDEAEIVALRQPALASDLDAYKSAIQAFISGSVLDATAAIRYDDCMKSGANPTAQQEPPMTTIPTVALALIALIARGQVAEAKTACGRSFSGYVSLLKGAGMVEKVDGVWRPTRTAVTYAVANQLEWARAAAALIGAEDLLPAAPKAAPKAKKASASGERANPWPAECEPPALDTWEGAEVKTWNGYTIYPLPGGFGARTPEGNELRPASGANAYKRQQAARWAVWAQVAVERAIVASA